MHEKNFGGPGGRRRAFVARERKRQGGLAVGGRAISEHDGKCVKADANAGNNIGM
jgi:hypothetical protein